MLSCGLFYRLSLIMGHLVHLWAVGCVHWPYIRKLSASEGYYW